LLNAVFGLLTIGAFHLLRKSASGDKDSLAALQFALLPLLLPYDFLVYTDVSSLGLVLGATAATLRGRHIVSGMLMILALGVRQTNVIWLPLLAGIALWPSLAPTQAWSWRERFARAWPYGVGALLFLAYWWWNGSISLSKGQAIAHPDFSLHVGNVYFALFLCGLLLPLHVALGLKDFAARARARPWLIAIPIALFFVFWCWFRVDHVFNQRIGDPPMLHNYLLVTCKSDFWCRMLLGLVAVAAACGLGATKLKPRVGGFFYPLAVLALASFWLIEQRYALIPLGLWLAFRERKSAPIEAVTTMLWALLAVCLCYGFSTRLFAP
jgi:alpha-1,2-glucosyltransferase